MTWSLTKESSRNTQRRYLGVELSDDNYILQRNCTKASANSSDTFTVVEWQYDNENQNLTV